MYNNLQYSCCLTRDLTVTVVVVWQGRTGVVRALLTSSLRTRSACRFNRYMLHKYHHYSHGSQIIQTHIHREFKRTCRMQFGKGKGAPWAQNHNLQLLYFISSLIHPKSCSLKLVFSLVTVCKYGGIPLLTPSFTLRHREDLSQTGLEQQIFYGFLELRQGNAQRCLTTFVCSIMACDPARPTNPAACLGKFLRSVVDQHALRAYRRVFSHQQTMTTIDDNKKSKSEKRRTKLLSSALITLVDVLVLPPPTRILIILVVCVHTCTHIHSSMLCLVFIPVHYLPVLHLAFVFRCAAWWRYWSASVQSSVWELFLVCRLQNLEGAHQCLVDTHHSTSVVKLSTIVRC